MGAKAVIEMFKQAENDEGLREALDAALEDQERGREAFLEVAAHNGFEFTAEDLADAAPEIFPPDGELNDEQLDGVAGGMSFQTRKLSMRALRKFAPPMPSSGIYSVNTR